MLLTSSSNQTRWTRTWCLNKETSASLLSNSSSTTKIMYKALNKCSKVSNNNNNRIYTSNSSNKCYFSNNSNKWVKGVKCNKWGNRVLGCKVWEDKAEGSLVSSRVCSSKKLKWWSSRWCRIRVRVHLSILTSETFMNWWYLLCKKFQIKLYPIYIKISS